MGKKNKSKPKTLTHEEIWDDSALVRSWDDAVEEYKLYHSIHAKGENVEEVLRKTEAAEIEGPNDEPLVFDEDSMDTENIRPGASMTTGEDEHSVQMGHEARDNHEVQPVASNTQSHQEEATTANASGAIPMTAPAGATNMPNSLLEGQDPALKNLMMAWYFAGYYTGLYEGQKRATQDANLSNNP